MRTKHGNVCDGFQLRAQFVIPVSESLCFLPPCAVWQRHLYSCSVELYSNLVRSRFFAVAGAPSFLRAGCFRSQVQSKSQGCGLLDLAKICSRGVPPALYP